MTITATRTPTITLASDQYICERCGIQKRCNGSRAKPNKCADCLAVECHNGHLRGENPPKRNGKLDCPECRKERQARNTANRRAARRERARTMDAAS